MKIPHSRELREGQVHPKWHRDSGDGSAFYSRPGSFTLACDEISEDDAADFRSSGTFGFLRHRGVLIFVIDFGPDFRMLVPYLGNPDCPCCSLELMPRTGQRVFDISLIETQTGIIRATRTVTLPVTVNQLLLKEILRQQRGGLEFGDGESAIKSMGRTFPTWSAVLEKSVTCQVDPN